MRLRRLLAGLLPLCLALLVSCRRDEKRVVGVVPKGANHVFWQSVHAGAVKAAREYGLEVEWNAPTVEIDSKRQIEIVDSMVNRHLAGIVLAPVDRKALVGVVDRAAAAGIPVSIFDSDVDTPKRVSYVATNNEEGGRMGARKLGELLGGKGKVAVIGFMPGSASTMEREHGFEDEMHSKFPAIEIVALQFGMADRAKSMAVTENILTANPGLNGLFADNESSTAGAIQALKTRGLRNVKLVGFDPNEQFLVDLKAGWVQAMVAQNPFAMGYESTKAVALKLRGETPLPNIDSGSALITQDVLEKPEINSLLHPDLATYLGR
jgi:ribose transport system substrate-binding protein